MESINVVDNAKEYTQHCPGATAGMTNGVGVGGTLRYHLLMSMRLMSTNSATISISIHFFDHSLTLIKNSAVDMIVVDLSVNCASS